MTRHGIPLGRILGIAIGLDFSWFLIFALLTWLLAASYFPGEFKNLPAGVYWAMGAATSILLFVSVLLHELGHSIVALRYKIPVRRITLFLFGGVAEIGAEPPSARAEFFIAIAGPLVSLALAALFQAIEPAVAAVQPLLGIVKYLAYINLAVVLFNLVPGYPLDGGRVFRALVWAITGNMRRATVVAANVGRFFGFFFIMVGVWMMLGGNFGGGIWIAFIGWFLDSAAASQVQLTRVEGLLSGHIVSQAMSVNCPRLPADIPLQRLVDEHILASGQRFYIVDRDDKAVGLINLRGILNVPRSRWSSTTVQEAMLPLNQLKSVSPTTELWAVLQLMDRSGVNQLPVISDGEVVGMLSREDVIGYLGALVELGKSAH